MPKAKRKRKAGPGRPKRRKSNSTLKWEFVRDHLLPVIGSLVPSNDPIEAMNMWLNGKLDTPNINWMMKRATEFMMANTDKKTPAEISDKHVLIEQIRAEAIKSQESENSGGGTAIQIITGALPIPNTPAGIEAVEKVPKLLDVSVVDEQTVETPKPSDADDWIG